MKREGKEKKGIVERKRYLDRSKEEDLAWKSTLGKLNVAQIWEVNHCERGGKADR